MIRLLVALLYLTHVVQGTATNATSSTCPDPSEASYRSVWSILGSCALTLVICLWHTPHVSVPEPGKKWPWIFIEHGISVIWCFIVPEWVIAKATDEWVDARKTVIYFHEKGYEWSMTHSYFAQNGGFAYCDRKGNVKVIKAPEFLDLCKEGKIMNPLVTQNEINDRSKSDAMSKAIFTFQLLWFVLQVSVRHFNGLVVTLVELDTLCMAVLAVIYLLIWWSKPLSAGCPHIFYESPEAKVYPREELSEAWSKSWDGRKVQSTTGNDEEKSLQRVTEGCCLMRKPQAAFNKAIQNSDSELGPMWVACSFLAGLHLIAWDYQFPTKQETWIWRGAALGLMGGAIAGIILWVLLRGKAFSCGVDYTLKCLMLSAVICRVMLAVLMFLSLRALPCSAHQIVSWVQYIPHL